MSGAPMSDGRLARHLGEWLGRWPARGEGLDVVASDRRERPGWDGAVHVALGVRTPAAGVLSVPPGRVDAVRALARRPTRELLAGLPRALGLERQRAYLGVFRWSGHPADLPDAGSWFPAEDPAVPDWLRVFGGEVLLALDPADGRYLAGVGIKWHDRYGREIAVGTEPAARGRGLARRLVAQAARRVLDEGAVPTYLHAPSNTASARVADAAGFPDLGWTVLGMGEVPEPGPP